jgi:polyisoprenoid-binding protein YceI
MSAPLRTVLLLAAGLAVAGAASAQQKVVPAQSEIGFTIKEQGVPVTGRFTKWTGDLAFDPKKPEAAKVSFVIDTASASFGSPETDAEVPKAPWFDSKKFPQATFVSSSVKRKDATHFDVAGKLTVKGAARDVVVPLTLAQAGPATTATGQFAIKRLEFKVGEGEWADTSLVADEVQVRFKLALTGIAPL